MHSTTESGSVSVNNLTSLQTLLTILMCAAANIQEDEAIKKVKEIIEKKNLEDMNKILQLYALPRHDLLWESNWRFLQTLSYVVAPLLWIFPTMPGLTFKAPITDKVILEDIVERLQKKLPEKTTEQPRKQSQEQLPEKTTVQNSLFEFLDNAYGEFQAFCVNKEQPDATRGSGDIQFEEDPKDHKIHIAVLGTNHVLAKVQLKHLEEKLAKQCIDKSKVCIHLLCKSGQNAVIQEAYGAEFAEDTLGEADEMDEIFKNKGFAEVKKHTVEGKYIGTKPTLEKFYQDCKGQLPKNLIFLCCPNTLNRQVADIKLFLAKKQVPQDIENSIQSLTLSYQETAKYLESLLNEIKDEKEKANEKEKYIIKFSLIKSEITLSNFFAETAKNLYAVLQMQKLKDRTQSSMPKEKPVEPSLPPPQSRELFGKSSKEQNKGTEQTQDTENGILIQDQGPVIEAIGQRGTGCCIM